MRSQFWWALVRVAFGLAVLVLWCMLAPTLWVVAAHAWDSGPTARADLVTFVGATWIAFRTARAVDRSLAWRTTDSRPITESGGNRPDLATARHEAAHLVCFAATGSLIIGVQMSPEGDSKAHVKSMTDHDRVEEAQWSALVGMMAGNVIDVRHDIWNEGSKSDVINALVVAAGLLSIGRPPTGYAGTMTTDGLLAGARREAGRILDLNADLLEDMASRLCAERGWVPARRLMGLIERVSPSEPDVQSETACNKGDSASYTDPVT